VPYITLALQQLLSALHHLSFSLWLNSIMRTPETLQRCTHATLACIFHLHPLIVLFDTEKCRMATDATSINSQQKWLGKFSQDIGVRFLFLILLKSKNILFLKPYKN
jgi:hypothetical protein